jgi:small conductance mechanosensitive channel
MREKFEAAFEGMWDKIDSWIEALVGNIPNLILAILVFVASIVVARILKKYFRRILNRLTSNQAVASLASSVLTVLIVLGGIFIALVVLNLDKMLTGLLTTAGLAGLAIGLALQGALANLFAGVILSLRSFVNPGDWIESNDYSGEVLEITLRNTRIKGPDNNIVVIPNRLVAENPLKNHSLTTKSRVIVHCGVGYGSDLNKVEKLTKRTLADLFDQLEESEVDFYYTEFGSSSINFTARFWLEARDSIMVLKAKSKAIKSLKAKFDQEGINIPFPIRTLYLESVPSALSLGQQSQRPE